MRASLFLGCPGEVMNELRICRGFAALVLLSAVVTGCGRDTQREAGKAAPTKVAKHTVPTAAAPAAIAAEAPISMPIKSAPVAATAAKPARMTALNPFQMPDVPEEFLSPKEEPRSDEYAAPNRQTERPKVRLLGFSDVDGFKALVELKGDVLAVEAGDVIEGVQVVSIQPPIVTFQFANSNWSTKLFDQPWSNQQTAMASTPGSSRTFAAQSRSPPRTNSPAYATRTPPAAALRGPAGDDVLEAGIPGSGVSSALPSIPGMPSGDGSSGIPGLGSIPGMPSGGAPGAGGMPGPPGGAGALPSGTGAVPGGPGTMSGEIN